MKISIEYCGMWNYYPRAASLAAAIKKEIGVEAELIHSGGGVFEIEKDGTLIFSKKALGRFPSNEEILAKLQ